MKIFIMNKNKDFKFAVFDIITLYFEVFNYSQEFLIVSFILNLYQNYLFKEKSYKMSLSKIKN